MFWNLRVQLLGSREVPENLRPLKSTLNPNLRLTEGIESNAKLFTSKFKTSTTLFGDLN